MTLEEYKIVLRKNPSLFSWFDILNNNSSINGPKEDYEKHKKEEEEKQQYKDKLQEVEQKLIEEKKQSA